MRLKLKILLNILLFTSVLNGQDMVKYLDQSFNVFCELYKYDDFGVLIVRNCNSHCVYIPDCFQIVNNCNRISCYLTNDASFRAFPQEVVNVIKIPPDEQWCFIIDADKNDLSSYEKFWITFLIDYVDKSSVMELIDISKRSYPDLCEGNKTTSGKYCKCE